MYRYILSRILQALVTIVIVSIVVFSLSAFSGNPALLMLGPDASNEDIAAMEKRLGTDKPIPVQYWNWAKHAITGDLGDSIQLKRPVKDLIRERLPNSLQLGAVTFGFSVVIALVLGTVAGVMRGSFVDFIVRFFTNIGHAAPSFWVAIVAISIFAVRFDILPAAGKGGPSTFVLPAVTLGMATIAGMMRLLRSSMIEVLSSDYIRVARAKGLEPRVVILRHAIRNALLPLITVAGLLLATIVTGSVIAETIFAWPGIGLLGFRAIQEHDFPVIQGVVLVGAVTIAFANLVVDILYGYIDPRIRLHRSAS